MQEFARILAVCRNASESGCCKCKAFMDVISLVYIELQPEKWRFPGTSVQAEDGQGGCWNFPSFHLLLQGTLYRGPFICCLQQEQGSQCEHLDKATFLFMHCTSVYLR